MMSIGIVHSDGGAMPLDHVTIVDNYNIGSGLGSRDGPK
jgi:hypothetical protein